MSRLIEANEEQRKAILAMCGKEARRALMEIHDILWPREDPTSVEWNADTIEEVANSLSDNVSRSILT